MNVTLPDGTIVKDIPDGTTKAQLAEKLKANGHTVPDEWLKTTPAPKDEPSLSGAFTNPEREAKIRGVKPPSLSGIATMVPESIMNAASGMVSKPMGDVAGLAAIPLHFMGVTEKDPLQVKLDVQKAMTYQPRHLEGELLSQYNPMALVGKGIGSVSKGVGGVVRGDGQSNLRNAAGDFVEEAIPQAIGLAGAKYGPPAVENIPQAMRGKAEGLMQSALKPTLTELKNGKATTAIDTMLDNNIPLSKKGVVKLREQIDTLNDQISESIKNSTGTVRVSSVLPYIQEKLEMFKKQVNPDADVAAVKQAWREFKDNPLLAGTGGNIPVQLAQDMKQGTYRQLSKKYGEMSTASNEAQKAIARGLKEGVAANAPEVVEFNKQESRLIRTLPIFERRVLMDANKNPLGLSLLTKDPVAWGMFMADKSAQFKALLARVINDSSGATQTAAKTVAPPVIAGQYMRPPQVNPEQQGQ